MTINQKIDVDSVTSWGTSSLTTLVELEFQHVVCDAAYPDRLGPRPDRLHAGLNTPVRSTSDNGLLVCLADGMAVHTDWSAERQCFIRRDGRGELTLADVRAWAALPYPIA